MSDNLKEAEYYLRFIVMYIDLATDTVRKILYSLTPSENVDEFFTSADVQKKLKSMRKSHILSTKEYALVMRSHVRPEDFDISLLITLLFHLYTSALKAPTNGWKLPVEAGDFTIAADLLRLREIRNKIVSHKPRAKMDGIKFKRHWGDVENILVRLTRQVAPDFETQLKKKMSDYSKMHLDQHDDNYRKYIDLLQEWYDGILNLQEQVEKSFKKMEEFQKYFRNKPKRYVHYIRLLLVGGKKVLCRLLEREISKRDQTLDIIIRDKLSLLKDTIKDEELLKQLCPNVDDIAQINSDIESMDIAVLASLIICILNDSEESDDDIINDVKTILEARQTYAESALVALDDEKFTALSGKLIASISFLCHGLDSDIRKHCKKTIASFNEPQGNQNDDDETYFNELTSHGSGIKSILEVCNETSNSLKAYVKTMEEEGIPFLKHHTLELKIVTLGTDEQKRKVVEDSLATIWQAALERSDNPSEFQAVREALDLILEDIRRIRDVEVGNLERQCIVFFFRCHSWCGILQLAEYFESFRFQQHLRNISVEVSLINDEPISIQGYLTLECLWEILTNPSAVRDETCNTLSVPIQCSSIGGMREVLKFLNDEQTTNRFNEIADTLAQSPRVIRFNVFPEVYGFKGVFEETDSENSSSGKSSIEEEAGAKLPEKGSIKEQQQFIADSFIAQTDEFSGKVKITKGKSLKENEEVETGIPLKTEKKVSGKVNIKTSEEREGIPEEQDRPEVKQKDIQQHSTKLDESQDDTGTMEFELLEKFQIPHIHPDRTRTFGIRWQTL